MRILITGNLGYIGTVLTPMLVANGHDVVGYDVDLYRDCTFGDGFVKVPTIHKDIRDIALNDLKRIDAICHLAALSNDSLGNLNPKLTFEINHKTSVRLAELAKRAGVQRYIFSSSCSSYGAAGDDMLTEDAPFNPVTPYGQSKVWTERDVSALTDDSFSPTFLRNATGYGVSPRLRFDLVLNNLSGWAFTTGKIVMESDGSPWRPIVHVQDIARAFAAVLEAPRELVHNKAFNVGVTKDNLQIRDIAKIVGKTIPNCQIEFAQDASPDRRCYKVNCGRLSQVLPNFRPQWNVRRGARELYESYKKQGLTFEEFDGPKYKRISQINKLLKDGIIDETLRYLSRSSNR